MNSSKEQIKKILDEAPEDATDWCVNIGGKVKDEYGYNGYDSTIGKMDRGRFVESKWNQIPLSDLRKQLNEEGWVNGLPPICVTCEVSTEDDEWYRFIPRAKYTPHYINSECFLGDFCDANTAWSGVLVRIDKAKFRKLETEAEKLERERLESAYELYCEYNGVNALNCMSFDAFKSNRGSERRVGFLAIVDKTNYRKGE